MAYIANKPVRFDRDYKVGEIIPDDVIAPSMTRKLVEMGRILCVDLPAPGGSAETPSAPALEGVQGGTKGEGGDTQAEPAAPLEGAEGIQDGEGEPGGEFVCLDCGKAFGSKNALSAHSRTHKG